MDQSVKQPVQVPETPVEKIVKPLVAPTEAKSTEAPTNKIAPTQVQNKESEATKKGTETEKERELTEEEVEALIPTEPYATSPLFYEMVNYFSVDQKDYDAVKNEMSVITEWAIRKARSNKGEDVLRAIRELEDNIRPPEWGERRYQNVYRYLRLERQQWALDQAKQAFSRGGFT